jgi:hypothetical protein
MQKHYGIHFYNLHIFLERSLQTFLSINIKKHTNIRDLINPKAPSFIQQSRDCVQTLFYLGWLLKPKKKHSSVRRKAAKYLLYNVLIVVSFATSRLCGEKMNFVPRMTFKLFVCCTNFMLLIFVLSDSRKTICRRNFVFCYDGNFFFTAEINSLCSNGFIRYTMSGSKFHAAAF